jgi:TonB family protein
MIVTGLAGFCLMVTTLHGAEIRKTKRVVQPKYPELALKMRVEGTVKLEAVVDSDGSVKNVIFISGPPLLKSAAIDSLKEWQYEPAKDSSLIPVEMNFRLPQ